MLKKGLPRKAVSLASAIAGVALLAFTAAPSASAATMRTLHLSVTCATGLPYGLEINNGSGWYLPSAPGTTYASGNTKYYTVYIPASATSLAYQPTYCANEQEISYPYWQGYTYGISPGTSTINATGYVDDYTYDLGYYGYLIYACYIRSLNYG